MLARDALPEETFDRGVVKEVEKEVETAFYEPKAVENHGLESPGVADEMVMTGLLGGGIDHVGDLQGVVGTGDYAEMTDGEDCGVVKTVNERHTKAYSLKVQRSCDLEYSEWCGG